MPHERKEYLSEVSKIQCRLVGLANQRSQSKVSIGISPDIRLTPDTRNLCDKVLLEYFVTKKFWKQRICLWFLIENTSDKNMLKYVKDIENVKNKPIYSQCNIFNLCCDLFSIITKNGSQIKNNIVCVVAHIVFVFCCALTTGRCNVFQHIFVNQMKSKFYGPLFQTVLFLVTMITLFKHQYFQYEEMELQKYNW